MGAISATDIISIIQGEIENINWDEQSRETGEVIWVGDGIVTVYGIDHAMYGEIVAFENGVKGMVQDVRQNEIGIILFGRDTGIKEGTKVVRTKKKAGIPIIAMTANAFEEDRKKAFEKHSTLTVVTGRRRIGKTTLIEKAMGEGAYVYFFVGKKSEAILCSEYADEIRTRLGIFVPSGIASFKDIFALLMEAGTSRQFTLVIDEFQNFMDVNDSVYSDIQNFWDKYRLKSHINMIVCGSVYSLMEELFKNRKEPLYGRCDHTIRLEPFCPEVMKEIIHDHYPGYSNDDLLALYTYTGGVPKYIELLVDAEALSKESIINYIAKQDSPFIEEGRKLLTQEFGKKYATYFSILQAISEGYNTQAEISDYLGSKSIGGQLLKLEETYNLIRKNRPMWAGTRTQTVKYEIADIFLRFWFRYIEKNQQLIEINQYPLLREIIASDYETYSGDILERYFRAKLIESMKYRAIGNWWDSKGYTDKNGNRQQCEIDIIAIHIDDKEADIFEVKRNADKFRINLLQEKMSHLKEKEKRIRKYNLHFACLSIEDM